MVPPFLHTTKGPLENILRVSNNKGFVMVHFRDATSEHKVYCIQLCTIIGLPALPRHMICTPERNCIPVYMFDTPVADDFSVSSCFDSSTESLVSAASCFPIFSG